MTKFQTIIFTVTLFANTLIASQSAVAQLPNFRTADDFVGQKVENMDLFVPTTNDFTLEVEATAGTPISIGFSKISYTPESSGKVRFVQQDGTIYVFENNAYATTLTPEYSFTEQGENIIRNGSFESVSEQFTTDRWKASDWDTWDGGTPTWGGEVYYVNVRENETKRSDGKKSIILHSRSRWLCQQITSAALEANATYLLSCDYWTSDGAGNGNGEYQVWFGSSFATNDVMTLQGYTTLEGDYTQQKFSTIFQAPSVLPSEIHFSLYRELSKVDWLDNVKLVKVLPDGQGIIGTTNATYRTGAYAPQSMTLPEGVSIDMTNSIANPDFDDGTMTGGAPAGWTLEAKATQSKISTGEKWGVIPANQNHWQIWQDGAALTGRAYQILTNIPNGRYSLSATVTATAFGGSVSLYANHGNTAIKSNAGKQYTTTGVVVDGTLEIGLSFATTGGLTIDYDSFTLKYLGMDAEGYREVLALEIANAKSVLNNLEEGYDPTPINEAVSAAEALTENASPDSVIAAIAAITDALADYQKYADKKAAERKNMAHFASLISAAKQERAADNYPGKDSFNEAIAKAEEFYKQLQANTSLDITEAADSLNSARETYYNSQYTITPKQQTVSYVDLTLNGSEKYVLRVDGKPYYGTEIQMRSDKMRGYIGWSEDVIKNTFKQAAADGFNTLSIPLFWSEVELEKNHFDWRILDSYLNWCKEYGVKAEILWFSWSSGGRVQYLWNVNGIQKLRTPDYVCSMEGTSEFNMLRTEWEYSLDWRDQNLIDRETYVLSRIMEHIALWDANNGNPHTVIGVQLGNEARAHGGNSATAEEIINYYHQVGSAVKNSKYVTWTRLNCVSYETWGRTNANENKRNNGGTNIDFVGIDVYGTTAAKIMGNVDGQLGAMGKNYRMIMEIDAKDTASPFYQLAALAGDKAYNYYNFGPVDGNGLYGANGTTLLELSHITHVRQRNKILNKANQDIALRSHGNGLYVYNYTGGLANTETGLAGITFTPDAVTTQAIAVRHSDSEIALLSTLQGTFTIPASLNATSAQRGYFDENNRWIKEGDVTITDNTITMPATSCVLITLDGMENMSGLVTWGDGTESSWTSPTSGPYYSGSKILLDGATITLGNEDDVATTWSYHTGNGGLIPSQMPSTDGTVSTLVTSFSATSPYGTLPANGCFLKVDATENGTLTVTCKPSTDAAQLLVFVTVDNEGNITAAEVNTGIWNASYDYQVEAGKTYYIFQLAKTGLLNSYRFTLKGVSFVKEGTKKIRVFTIGDSTMANKTSATERGWGMLFPTFVDPAIVTVNNHAVDGRSTLSFINEGRWTTVVNQLVEGDYVLIQFGHNDEKTDASLHTDPQTTYKQNLTLFVNETLAKGAHPVLMTPIVRRIFGSDGNILNEHTEYAEAVRQLSEELSVPLIDMTLLSAQYENIAGIVGSRALHEYFPGSEIDNTHLCNLGAYITARCVAEQIAANDQIEIALNSKPAALDGAYSSTLDFAKNAASMESFDGTLSQLDSVIRQQRLESRQSLTEGDDATFALVNPDFAEGFCWYNAVQATRPMGWALDYSGGLNIKTATSSKPEGSTEPLISSGQEHLQLWGISATGSVSQEITGLANGRYEISVTYCKSGEISTMLFANNASAQMTENNVYKVETDVTDGTIHLGIKFSSTSGSTIDIDNFTLLKISDSTTSINGLPTGEEDLLNGAIYNLSGMKLQNCQKGINIIRLPNGKTKKIIVK